jgi:hypothetical protein
MRSPALPIRVLAYEALVNRISLIDYIVPVYDGFAPDTGTFPRIVIQGVSGGGGRFTKCAWGDDWFLSVKVSSTFKSGVTQNVNDTIVDLIFELLLPLNGPYLEIGVPFYVWNASGQILNTLLYEDGVSKYIDTDLQFTFSITE